MSHLNYYARRPRIPKSLLNKYREGLIVGSACEAGELFSAVAEERPADEIARIVQFYDYLEIQPIGNNHFMIDSEKHPNVHNEEDLRELNRKIVALGEQFNKKVCATCDVHFLNPNRSLYRSVIMAGKGFAPMQVTSRRFIFAQQRKCLKSLIISVRKRQRKLSLQIRI